ncbi:NAD-dependent glycerol-3-phosphate dehydrogenase family protein [Rhodococcus sp. MTM3W5.2]|nr:NAD-dependent glycerol-3-phosphate dehydrogenase family protein [Rhodococcus sp. MTM3W5.2]
MSKAAVLGRGPGDGVREGVGGRRHRRHDVGAETRSGRGDLGGSPESVLPRGIALPPSLSATSDHRVALEGADIVVLAVPSQSLRENLGAWAPSIEPDSTLLSLAKGIESGTLMRMSQVISQVAGADPSRVAVLSGPNLAREIAVEQPAATVIACTDSVRAVDLQKACATGYFRPYTNSDVIGCEVGGACKNVIALACGMASGIGLGRTPTQPSSPVDWRR